MNTYAYYFEVKINTLNSARPGIVIGLTDETFPLNKALGNSKRSFGLRSDGKLFHSQSQVHDFGLKFLPDDIIGCGICFISRKIFFTRNSEVLGKSFDIQESFTVFASASISAPQDSITFSFTGPFAFNIDKIIVEESQLMESEINSEQINSTDLYKLIKEYLEYQGYPNTLKALEENMDLTKFDKSHSKIRSNSGRISERYESLDIDPECQTCQNYGKICKNCLKNVMEHVEASTNIRLPESRNRCDSVDLASFYLKNCEYIHEEEPLTPLKLKDIQMRGALRQAILTGNMTEVRSFLTENFPEMLCDEICMLYIYVQEFIEIIKSNDSYLALDFAREKLAKYKDFIVFYRDVIDCSIFVWEVVGLLAYLNPFDSPLSSLLTKASLELTADLINERLLQKTYNTKGNLENLLKQTIETKSLYQEYILMTQTGKISIAI